MNPFIKKSILILSGIVFLVMGYTWIGKSSCEARISYDTINLNEGIDLEQVFAVPDSIFLDQVWNDWQNFAVASDELEEVAAYNVAPTNFSKILRQQEQDSYYDINVNKETSQYIFRIIAIKELT